MHSLLFTIPASDLTFPSSHSTFWNCLSSKLFGLQSMSQDLLLRNPNLDTYWHADNLRTCARTHTNTQTHTCLFILEMGGWRTQRFTSQSLAFLNLLFAVYWVSNPISYTPQPRHNVLLSAVFAFLILWDSWFALINKSMLYGHLFCIELVCQWRRQY